MVTSWGCGGDIMGLWLEVLEEADDEERRCRSPSKPIMPIRPAVPWKLVNTRKLLKF